MMNYREWSNEYYSEAEKFALVIDRLKKSRRGASKKKKKELDAKIAAYRCFYHECVDTANHLMDRSRGVA